MPATGEKVYPNLKEMFDAVPRDANGVMRPKQYVLVPGQRIYHFESGEVSVVNEFGELIPEDSSQTPDTCKSPFVHRHRR